MTEPAPVSAGTFVSWNGDMKGRVVLIVTSGFVPGIEAAVPGTATDPAARIATWRFDGRRWTPTGRCAAAKVAALAPISPLYRIRVDAAAPGIAEQLTAMHAEHLEKIYGNGSPLYCAPSAEAVREVFHRAVLAQPGDWRSQAAQDAAVRRVETFLALAAGHPLEEHARDADLLPAGHPMRD